jgi:hypothetical protein
MAKAITKYTTNQLVQVKGRKAPARISWPVAIRVPTIINGDFVMQQRIMYKFVEGSYAFYAWEDDVTLAKSK